MKRTYVDSNVLIEAFRGQEPGYRIALGILDDPGRELVVSDFLKLEVLPKPIFHNREEEIAFMEEVLSNAAENVSNSNELIEKAIDLASKYDLTPMDAIHVAAAMIAEVDELVTMEKPTKPICRVKEVNVVSIYPQGENV